MGLCFLSEKSRLFAFAVHFVGLSLSLCILFSVSLCKNPAGLLYKGVVFALCKNAALVAVQKCKSFKISYHCAKVQNFRCAKVQLVAVQKCKIFAVLIYQEFTLFWSGVHAPRKF